MIRRGLSLSVTALLLQVGAAEAASLDKESCDKLKGEQSQLESTGARGNMVKGPEWAKANLAADKLEEIKRLIEVEELLLFRCQGRPLVVLPAELELDPAAKPGETKEDGKEPAAKDAKAPAAEKKAAPAAKKAAAPPAKAAAKKVDAPAKAAAPAAKAAKAKPKADDAYRPPSGATNADPFATQLAPGVKKLAP
jgi:hypothetical protein